MADKKSAGTHDKGGHEVELKLRVRDLADLLRIGMASGGTPAATVVQTNGYFDTPSRSVDAARFVVRLREERSRETNEHFVTVKGPAVVGGGGPTGLTTVVEEEVAISAAEADALRAGGDPLAFLERDGASAARRALVVAVRAAQGGQRLSLVGGFDNERTRLPCTLDGVDVVLELDRTRFPGDQVHYEVELEVPSGADVDAVGASFHALFQRAGVVGTTSVGKARRFFAALRGERLA